MKLITLLAAACVATALPRRAFKSSGHAKAVAPLPPFQLKNSGHGYKSSGHGRKKADGNDGCPPNTYWVSSTQCCNIGYISVASDACCPKDAPIYKNGNCYGDSSKYISDGCKDGQYRVTDTLCCQNDYTPVNNNSTCCPKATPIYKDGNCYADDSDKHDYDGGNGGCESGQYRVTDSLCCKNDYTPVNNNTTCCPKSSPIYKDGNCYSNDSDGYVYGGGCDDGEYQVTDSLCCKNDYIPVNNNTTCCPKSSPIYKDGNCYADSGYGGGNGGWSDNKGCPANTYWVNDHLCCDNDKTPVWDNTTCCPKTDPVYKGGLCYKN
ncbi:hypothetical protein BC830DRAFT_1174795 [Chytriomyces sp. MP71]|nr:hypothetical protein BC830DRAFT_1174795 [Chytriomyces sp. MP71]